jgi:hypothetical protein
MLPLAMLVLLAMGVPINIGGWGPREGVAAWSFAAAGLGASHGVATATVYGVMVFVASLPGAVVLVVARRRSGHPDSETADGSHRRDLPAKRPNEPRNPAPVALRKGGAVHG